MKAITPSANDVPVVHLRPPRGWLSLNLRDLWQYRELIYFLTWRDLKVRYKQTLLGALWAVLRPFLTMVVFSIFFGELGKVPSENLPYPVFAYTGLLPWELFATALTVASHSLVNNRHMITKIYFPRLILPMASILAGVVDFLIASVVLAGIMLYFRTPLSGPVWPVIFFLLLTLITALGVGLWLSALNVMYRDINYITPFLSQFWLLITPIAYGSSLVPEGWRILYALNPMVGVVNGFRWALLGMESGAPGPMMWVSVLVSLLLLVSGLIFFRRMERQFADMV